MDEQVKTIDDLALIKKYYGEKMMQYCRSVFSTLLETPGLLFHVISVNFESSKSLYDDLDVYGKTGEFKNYIYIKAEREDVVEPAVLETPEELLQKAGYVLYECKTEDDIQSFKKYYSDGEKLCTFLGGRLDRCHVWFAVKSNVEEVKRTDFSKPERQDEYGTSVISIQFTRDSSHTLSIKNRYNHRVLNPDATFSNNLDNIMPGLTDSFAENYGMTQSHASDFELPGYVKTNEGKYYKYNYEINNIYYCPNNIIIDNFEVKRFSKDRYILIDYFLIDLQTKTVSMDKREHDSFVKIFKNVNNIEIMVDGKNKKIRLTIAETAEEINIIVDKNNRIVGLSHPGLINAENDFLQHNQGISELDLPHLESADHNFLKSNQALVDLQLPSLQRTGDGFLCFNKSITNVELPLLEELGDGAFRYNEGVKRLSAPLLRKVGYDFFYTNKCIEELSLPLLVECGNCFLEGNINLTRLELPSLRYTGSLFLYDNSKIDTLDLPLLEKAGKKFLYNNRKLIILNLPSLVVAEESFLDGNEELEELRVDSLEEVEDRFCWSNKSLKKLYAPKLKKIGYEFLYQNKDLEDLHLPSLLKVGYAFLYCNSGIRNVSLPALVYAGNEFLESAKGIKTFRLMGKVKIIDKANLKDKVSEVLLGGRR